MPNNSGSIEIPLDVSSETQEEPEEINTIASYFGYANNLYDLANNVSIWDTQTEYPNTCTSVDIILGEKCMLGTGHKELHKFIDENNTLRWAG